MAHSETRDKLIELANSNNGDPGGFLEGLSPIHDDWHGLARTYGFLLFHHRVVRYFKAIVNPALDAEVTPFSSAQFQSMNMEPFSGDAQNVNSLNTLAEFSRDIENWHNGAHNRIGAATGVPMMDARQNIFFRAFWQLHLYIDAQFQPALLRYAEAVHPNQFLDVTAIAGHIEASHHGWVRSI